MIDPLNDTLVSLTDAAKLLPGRPSVHLLWRWRTAGVRNVKLETVLIGGKRYTSTEAIQAFVRRTTAAADGDSESDNPKSRGHRTTRQAGREHTAAKKELQETGLPVPV
jgi:hypothetical protein